MTEVWENDDEEAHWMQHQGWAAYEADDLELAESLFQKAADLGNESGMYGLGRLAYDAGDLVLAKSWYQKSADLGNLDAIAALEHLRRSN